MLNAHPHPTKQAVFFPVMLIVLNSIVEMVRPNMYDDVRHNQQHKACHVHIYTLEDNLYIFLGN